MRRLARYLGRASIDAVRSRDRGAWYAMLGRLTSSAAGLALAAVAVGTLTSVEQGFFFTFLSLLLLQTFLELGFGVVLTQYASHEWAHVELGPDGAFVGRPRAAARLASLVRLASRWYLAVGALVVAVIGSGGFAFLGSQGGSGVDWEAAWWLLVVAQAAYVQVMPVSALLEGCGRVDVNQRGLVLASLAGTVAGLSVLVLGGELFSVPAMVGARAVVANVILRAAARDVLEACRLTESDATVDWRREVWPQQWRLAFSWAAGFAMFQSFVPIAFAVSGPVVAGQVGIAVQALVLVQALGMAWVISAQPRMGELAAHGRIRELLALAQETLARSVATALAAAVGALLLLTTAYAIDREYAERFGDVPSLVVFLACAVLLQLSNVETAAVRFQKHEPFLAVSVLGAVLVVISNSVLGGLFGLRGMALGFAAVIVCVLLPWIHVIFRRYTRVDVADARPRAPLTPSSP